MTVFAITRRGDELPFMLIDGRTADDALRRLGHPETATALARAGYLFIAARCRADLATEAEVGVWITAKLRTIRDGMAGAPVAAVLTEPDLKPEIIEAQRNNAGETFRDHLRRLEDEARRRT